jgi:hypothetical protein
MSQSLPSPLAPVFNNISVSGDAAIASLKTPNWTTTEVNGNYRIMQNADSNPSLNLGTRGTLTLYSRSSVESEGPIDYPVKILGDSADQKVGVDLNSQAKVWSESGNMGFQSDGTMNSYVSVGQSVNTYVGNTLKVSVQNNNTAIQNRLLVAGAQDNNSDALQVNGAAKVSMIKFQPQVNPPPAVRGGYYFSDGDSKFKKCEDGVNWINA